MDQTNVALLASAAAAREQYVSDLELAERAQSQERASAQLACDRRIQEARTRYREACEHAWLRYISKISGGTDIPIADDDAHNREEGLKGR